MDLDEKAKGNLSEEENLSAEELDSDDLGEDITGARGAQPQQQMVQPQQMRQVQPQNF